MRRNRQRRKKAVVIVIQPPAKARKRRGWRSRNQQQIDRPGSMSGQWSEMRIAADMPDAVHNLFVSEIRLSGARCIVTCHDRRRRSRRQPTGRNAPSRPRAAEHR